MARLAGMRRSAGPGPRSLSTGALGQYGKLPAVAYRLGMESGGPTVSQANATTLTVVKGAPGQQLAQTRARCQAMIAAAEASVYRAQLALSAAQERLRRAQEVESRFRERQAGRMRAA